MTGCHGVFDVDETLLKQCTFTECLECRRGFCIACQKPWHPGKGPFSFFICLGEKTLTINNMIIGVMKIVNDEEELKKTLKKAEQNHWCRCPKCSRIVEKVVSGITHRKKK